MGLARADRARYPQRRPRGRFAVEALQRRTPPQRRGRADACQLAKGRWLLPRSRHSDVVGPEVTGRSSNLDLRRRPLQGLVDEPANFLRIQHWARQAQTVEEFTGDTVIEMNILGEIVAIRRLQTSDLALQRRWFRQRRAVGIDD